MGASKRRKLAWALVLFGISFLIAPVQADEGVIRTSCYVFASERSTIVQTGGFAGVHWTYVVEGRFCLIVNPDTATARFERVDANAVDVSEPARTLDPNAVFNLTALAGAVADETIEFAGQTDDGSSVHLTLAFTDDTVHLIGQTTPPPNSADFFAFRIDAVAARKYAGGTGDPNTPYQIATAADLIALGETPEDYDKHFVLTADIDLDPNLPGGKIFDRAVIASASHTEVHPYTEGSPFTGCFDGNDRTISHLTIAGKRYLGLFGQLGPAANVFGLGLEAVEVSGADGFVGGLVGYNYNYQGRITGCYSTGSVSGTGSVGGLIGYNAGNIAGSHSIASVRGTSSVGGLAGGNFASITASYSSSSVSGNSGVGGLVGWNDGGIVASHATASVNGDKDVGGLVGFNSRSIAASYSCGTVSGSACVGGLVGHNRYGSIAASYSSGTISGSGSNIGGLVGYTYNGTASLSFWDIQTSGQPASAGGIGLTTSEMQDINTFLRAGWDFADEVLDGTCDYWQMRAGEYPRLYHHAGNRPSMPEGRGTDEQPYLVQDARDLGTVWFEPLAHYRLAESVDLSGITWSTAVIPWFRGSFDGDGYVIRHLHIQGENDLGLFGLLCSWSISNLGLEAVDVGGTGDNVGSLAGHTAAGSGITTSYSSGSVSGTDSVGGLVGRNGGNIVASYSSNSVRGDSSVGGLVGHNTNGLSMSCSYSSVSGGSLIGGLVGYNSGRITTSYSNSSVAGDWGVGGLVGQNANTIAMTYSSGTVSGTECVGGLVGYQRSSRILSSFWDTQTSGQHKSAGGMGKTTADMQTAATFLDAGWDFVGETANGTEDVWWILEGQDYPRLWWERDDEASL